MPPPLFEVWGGLSSERSQQSGRYHCCRFSPGLPPLSISADQRTVTPCAKTERGPARTPHVFSTELLLRSIPLPLYRKPKVAPATTKPSKANETRLVVIVLLLSGFGINELRRTICRGLRRRVR